MSKPAVIIPPPRPKMTLTLIVEYEEQTPDDVFEGIKELIESARGYGRPIKATLVGVPAALEML